MSQSTCEAMFAYVGMYMGITSRSHMYGLTYMSPCIIASIYSDCYGSLD